jgi:ABC-2 type transport system ATP-binding protein
VSSDDAQFELIALRRRYGKTVVLDGLTFTVPRGEVYGFLRPNGVRSAA